MNSPQIIIDAYSTASEEHPTRNEDAHFTLEQGIAGVFDGMGGYGGSEEASRFVAEFCADALQNESTATPPEAMRMRLQYVLEQAQEAFMETYRTRTQRIGTTAILASIVTDPESNVPYACFAYAGDSRGHIYRNDQAVFTTLDHGISSDLPLAEQREIQNELAAALYSADIDPYYLPYLYQRNIITSSFSNSSRSRFVVDSFIEPLTSGDKLLVTSDGIHDNLTAAEIGAVLAGSPQAAQALVADAKKRSREPRNQIRYIDGEPHEALYFRPKPDDMTAVVLSVQ